MGCKPDRRPMIADRPPSPCPPLERGRGGVGVNHGGLRSVARPATKGSVEWVGGRLDDWEARWAPYDEPTYQTALSFVQPGDIVLDIGAGDLRLARRLAGLTQRVYAIERQPGLLSNQPPLPDNLTVLCADARFVAWPKGITLAVLLMRHCTHVGLYVARLRAAGCQYLITNARWGMDVELMDLGPRAAWATVDFGWYACTCGQTGFVPGPPEQLSDEARMELVVEVEDCPACAPGTIDKARNNG